MVSTISLLLRTRTVLVTRASASHRPATTLLLELARRWAVLVVRICIEVFPRRCLLWLLRTIRHLLLRWFLVVRALSGQTTATRIRITVRRRTRAIPGSCGRSWACSIARQGRIILRPEVLSTSRRARALPHWLLWLLVLLLLRLLLPATSSRTSSSRAALSYEAIAIAAKRLAFLRPGVIGTRRRRRKTLLLLLHRALAATIISIRRSILRTVRLLLLLELTWLLLHGLRTAIIHRQRLLLLRSRCLLSRREVVT